MNLREVIERQAPWLVKTFNGVQWITAQEAHDKRLTALEAHIQDLETRYSVLENTFLLHANGQTHRGKKESLPTPDTE